MCFSLSAGNHCQVALNCYEFLHAGQLHQALGAERISGGHPGVGETSIYPGDFVFGDLDGVVVIPQRLIENVLVEAEKTASKERKMHHSLRRGTSLKEVHKNYGSF